jgi:hypothetical protein
MIAFCRKTISSSVCELLAALAFLPALAMAGEITPQDDIHAAVRALQPGDELVLGFGEYTLNSPVLINLYGTADKPIVIRAKAGVTPVLRQTNSSRYAIDIDGAAYIELHGIKINGGLQGIRMREADYITVADCEIYDTQDVALAVNWTGTYTGLKLVRNHIHHTKHTGEGMYLGCNHDFCRVENSLIDGNYIHHTNGPTITQGDGIELKEGSSGNVISNNVIHDTNYPGILTYSTVGNGPPNIIEGNIMWNSDENGMQVAADAIIRNNIIIGAPVVFQRHQAGSPSNLEFVNNTVIVPGTAINVSDVTGSVVIANNAIYSQSGSAINLASGDLGQVTLVGNVGKGGLVGRSSGYTEGTGIANDFVNGHFGGLPIDLFPRGGSALIAAGNKVIAPPFDFNGSPRLTPHDAGAYAFRAGGNPGWVITKAFKGLRGEQPNPPVLHVE